MSFSETIFLFFAALILFGPRNCRRSRARPASCWPSCAAPPTSSARRSSRRSHTSKSRRRSRSFRPARRPREPWQPQPERDRAGRRTGLAVDSGRSHRRRRRKSRLDGAHRPSARGRLSRSRHRLRLAGVPCLKSRKRLPKSVNICPPWASSITSRSCAGASSTPSSPWRSASCCWAYVERIYAIMQRPIMDALHAQRTCRRSSSI